MITMSLKKQINQPLLRCTSHAIKFTSFKYTIQRYAAKSPSYEVTTNQSQYFHHLTSSGLPFNSRLHSEAAAPLFSVSIDLPFLTFHITCHC